MKLQWLKLDINILDDEKIKVIRKYPDGDKLIVMWIGLLCIAMKSCVPGYLYIAQGLPCTVDDLTSILKMDKKVIQLGLDVFRKYRMIEIIEGGLIEIVNFRKHQEIEKFEIIRDQTKLRMQRYREKQKEIGVTRSLRSGDATDKTRIDKIRLDKNKYSDFVTMTEKEYNKLVLLIGEHNTKACVTKLDDYKGEKNKKYASDYRAIRNWVINEVTGKPTSAWDTDKKVVRKCSKCGKSLENEIRMGVHHCYGCDAIISKITGGTK